MLCPYICMNIQGILLTTDEALKDLDLNALKKDQLDIFYEFYNITEGGFTFDTLKEYLEITQNDANIITTIWKTFFPLAIGLMVLYMLLAMISELSSGRKEPDIKFFAIHFMKMGLAWALISYGPGIIGGLASLGNHFLNIFANINFLNGMLDVEKKKEYAHQLYNACKELGTWEKFTLNGTMGLVSLASNIPTIGLILQAISRKLEIILRGGFAVIALPNIFHGDHRSGSIKFLKKFASACLLGAGMVMVINIASGLNSMKMLDALMAGSETGVFKFPNVSTILNAFLYNYACIGIIPVIKQIINEALD